jgi:exopolysaccharide biosynthesis predicted pyruvyltransferase EpsI
MTSVGSHALANGSSQAVVGESLDRFRRDLDAALDQYIPRGLPAALLMFPYDGNVGNHLMWIGITDYLRERGIRVGYAAHGSNFSERDLARAVGDGPILFSGGVTISRLWPHHAEVKRRVAAAFPKNALISLPSTVLFVDDADREGARDIFGSHDNVTVLTRDPVSGAQARDAFPAHIRVTTAPDLAFRLPPQPIRGEPLHDIIWLARDDIEGAFGTPPAHVYVFDWPLWDLRTYTPVSYYLLRASGVLSRLRSSFIGTTLFPALDPPIAEFYRTVSHRMLVHGNHMLDAGKVLVTDRMHPHVLAALRGQDVVLLPDKFGKNRAVYDNYTKACSTVHWADAPAEALALAQNLARQNHN